jgi:hypothetical protein
MGTNPFRKKRTLSTEHKVRMAERLAQAKERSE